MPIKIDLHNNTSTVRVKPKGKDQVDVESSCNIDKKRFEALLDEEIKNRILGDAALDHRIDDLEASNVRYLRIDELSNGSINISILTDKGKVLDTKTITLTEKIIKSAVLDEEHGKIIYTCNDDSVIELDISTLVGQIDDIISEIAGIKRSISGIESGMSILDDRLSTAQLSLSEIIETTIPAIDEEIIGLHGDINTINGNIAALDNEIDNINITLNEITDEAIPGINDRLDIIETDLSEAFTEIIGLKEDKLDKNLSILNEIIPKDLEVVDAGGLLVYIYNNGVPSRAKLTELGFARIRD